MKKYFFVPGNRIELIQKAKSLEVDQLIIDLEDAIDPADLNQSVANILQSTGSNETYIRFPFLLPNIPLDLLTQLLESGYQKFVIPKVETEDDLDLILNLTQRFKLDQPILLIESPKAILDLQKLVKHPINPCAIALGSHDYCNAMGMSHNLENLYWARMQILHHAKANDIEAIDIASMNTHDKSIFEKECLDGFHKGFDAKLFIHPRQLEFYSQIKFFPDEDVSLALQLKQHIEKIGGKDRFTIVKLEGTVIEKPHLAYFNRVLKMSGNGTF